MVCSQEGPLVLEQLPVTSDLKAFTIVNNLGNYKMDYYLLREDQEAGI